MDDSRFFAFLRYSLRLADEVDVEGMDWEALYAFGERQTLTGVLFEGVQRLPREKMPRGSALFRWIGQGEVVRKANQRLDHASVKVYGSIVRQGFPCCILKGQGNALMYPNPRSRMPGDVDVWVQVSDRRELRDLARRLVEEEGFRLCDENYSHIGMVLGGVPVELHPVPAVLCHPFRNHLLRKWFKENSSSQFFHRVSLPGGVGVVAVPTDEFNIVYQLLHIYHHYFFEGVGLRQLADYLLLLRGMGADKARTCHEVLRQLGLREFAGAVMWVLHEVFGLQEEGMLVPMDARRGRPLLNDILRGGNFGKSDSRFHHSFIGHNFQRLDRDLRLLRHYPAETLCEPWYRLWHFLWRMGLDRTGWNGYVTP